MNLRLNIYTDETLTELKRVAEADSLKIPYRVGIYIAQSLETLDIKNNNDLLHFISGSMDKVDKIIKATFGITETELECVDIAELGTVAMELFKWGLDKIQGLNGGEKNAQRTTQSLLRCHSYFMTLTKTYARYIKDLILLSYQTIQQRTYLI